MVDICVDVNAIIHYIWKGGRPGVQKVKGSQTTIFLLAGQMRNCHIYIYNPTNELIKQRINSNTKNQY